jgi:hypothetical protein
MEPSPDRVIDDVRARVSDLCAALGACAAGYWRLDAKRKWLVQVVFVPGKSLDPHVGREFAAATIEVPLSHTDLGIVAAAITGQAAVSRVEDLPADSGSGRWLRAFEASRSVAVPIQDAHGSVYGVISVALPEQNQERDELIAARLMRSQL